MGGDRRAAPQAADRDRPRQHRGARHRRGGATTGCAGRHGEVAPVSRAATVEGAAAMIDQEIRDALNVDPSPEFLARVRTRVANEPEPSTWRWSWTIATVGALAAAV